MQETRTSPLFKQELNLSYPSLGDGRIKAGEKRKNSACIEMNNGPTDQEGSDSSKQKLKVTRACFLCKKSHAACDNNRPCSRCISMGRSTACVDAEAKKRGRKPRNQNPPPTGPPHYTPIEKRRKIGEDGLPDGVYFNRTSPIFLPTPIPSNIPLPSAFNIPPLHPTVPTPAHYSNGSSAKQSNQLPPIVQPQPHRFNTNTSPPFSAHSSTQTQQPVNRTYSPPHVNGPTTNKANSNDGGNPKLLEMLSNMFNEIKALKEATKVVQMQNDTLLNEMHHLKAHVQDLQEQQQQVLQVNESLHSELQQFKSARRNTTYNNSQSSSVPSPSFLMSDDNPSGFFNTSGPRTNTSGIEVLDGFANGDTSSTPSSPSSSCSSPTSPPPSIFDPVEDDDVVEIPHAPSVNVRSSLALSGFPMLADSRSPLPFLINNAENPFIMLKSHPGVQDGAFIAANYPFLKLVGYSLSELLGCSWRKIVLPEYQEHCKSMITSYSNRKSTRAASGIIIFKPVVVTKGGSAFEMVAKHQVFYDDTGSPMLHIISSDMQVKGASSIPIEPGYAQDNLDQPATTGQASSGNSFEGGSPAMMTVSTPIQSTSGGMEGNIPSPGLVSSLDRFAWMEDDGLDGLERFLRSPSNP